ncbi:hypothetical protein N7466_005063 [Penicillium verhagenii]|uniref:uncharacterized protein n=1 Tax=Penicillium verhagenii TaxID=1562060 RepID=UPI00254575D0|nr:uncharacterized protein N7466_005063 [Penicillium verhagenii]KAJ5935516.1 hypothetical protein N7466_005063 [Penicillium verhagenii]
MKTGATPESKGHNMNYDTDDTITVERNMEPEQGSIKRNPSNFEPDEKQDVSPYPPPKAFPHEVAFVIVVCAAQLMTQAGLALSIAPLKQISDSFNSTPQQLTWASSAYSLTVGTFILVSGRLGDVYGHRLMFMIGFVWFAVWSLLAGFSVWSNPRFFDCCRAFQGIGPAFLLPNAVAILGRTYPPGERKGMVFCMFGAVAPGGFIIGATLSSLIAEELWWPWAYWIFAIACVVFAVLGFLVIPPMPQEKPRPELSTFARLDGLGASLGVSGMILFNFAWNQAATVGWQVPYNYVLLIVGILIIGAFLYVESKAAYPLLPRSVFKGETGWVLGCVCAGWSSFGVVVFYFYAVMTNIESNTGLLVTAKFSGVAISGAIAAVCTGILLGRLPACVIMFIAMVAFAIGQALLVSLPIGQIYWANAFLISIITPWGMDMSFPSGILILSNAMPAEDQGVAGSLVTTAVNYSISLGLGFAGVVESYVNDDGQDILKGYRGASYMGLGLAGLGVIVATSFMIVTWTKSR